MDHQYFVVELAHSGGGQVKRIQISYKSIVCLVGAAVILSLGLFGAFSSYVRMFLKVSHYNELRADFERLRGRYQNLQQISKQHNQQMASLESLASEVSAAYGIKEPGVAGMKPMDDDFARDTNVKESIQEYNFLKAANFSHIYHNYAHRWQANVQPSLWPVNGVLRSPFGGRVDPFSGEGTFHTGIDLTAAVGTDVHVTADGVVTSAGWSGRYGKLVIVDHGNGVETYYAHLSQFLVVPGQEVRRNEVIALSGGTGHVTGPHIHYEVRVAGTPVNPYKYLGRAELVQAQRAVRSNGHDDLGL